MPFISESITNEALYKKAATGFSKDHILIKPLSRPNTALGRDFDVKSCFMPSTFRPFADGIYHFDVKPDDVWILGFPGSGVQLEEIVWLILNDYDFEKATTTPLEGRTSFLEQSAVQHPQLFKSVRSSIDSSRRAAEPRIIKSHLPVALLPIQLWRRKPKIICGFRNPGDMSKAYYEQYYHLNGYQGTYEEFCQLLMANRVVYAPYLTHLTEMWRMRDEENFFVQKFDEMTTDLEDFVRRLAEFLGKTINDEQVESLKEYVSQLPKNTIDIALTNKLWKRKPDAQPSDTMSQIDFIVDKWAQQTFDEFDLQLN
ncbi:sulfotransferase 4A1-like [Bradysia coprophila]|uniref:sulfotransferase 4A1-like n=1 Tax=Bradysia coprophila TaxID=38358 RepID=UPI00187D70F3|nr:sulfotransferase 4A1-like [Bradysia coprophila]